MLTNFHNFFTSRLCRKFAIHWLHITPTVLLHYLVKQKYPKTNNIVQSLVVTSLIVGQFKEIPVRKLTY